MFCRKCGTENKDGARFCKSCGEEIDDYRKLNPPELPSMDFKGPSAGKTAATKGAIKALSATQVKIAAVVIAGVAVVAGLSFSGVLDKDTPKNEEEMSSGILEEEEQGEDYISKFTEIEVMGTWFFFPDRGGDSPDTEFMREAGVTREPYILRLSSDNRAGFAEGVKLPSARGMPAAYHYTGTWHMEKDVLYLDLTGIDGDTLDMKIAVEGVDEDGLTLRWQSEAPPYYDYDGVYDGTFQQIGRGAFEQTVRFTSNTYYYEEKWSGNPGGGWTEIDYDAIRVQRPDRFVEEFEYYVTTSAINIRIGPGVDYERQNWYGKPIPMNMKIKKLGEMNGNPDWIFVEYDVPYDSKDDFFHTSEAGYFGADHEGNHSYCFYGWINTDYIMHVDEDYVPENIFPITPEMAIEIVRGYYEKKSQGYVPGVFEHDYDGSLINGEKVLRIHAYDIINDEYGGHTATAGWIVVGEYTGYLYDQVFDELIEIDKEYNYYLH